MSTNTTRVITRSASCLAGLFIVLTLTGCIGIYDNRGLFDLPPKEGMEEIEMIRSYGAPDYSDYVEDQKVHVYKVRENRYIILIGLYAGYDLVATCENGVVIDVGRVERPWSFSLFQPVPWAETN